MKFIIFISNKYTLSKTVVITMNLMLDKVLPRNDKFEVK